MIDLLIMALLGLVAGGLANLVISQFCNISWSIRVTTCLLSSALWVLVAVRFTPPAVNLAYGLLVSALITQSVIDARTNRLPRQISYAALALGTPLLIGSAWLSGPRIAVFTGVLGAVLVWSFFAVLRKLNPPALGAGDVHFVPLLGAYLGWLGLDALVVGFVSALFLAGGVAVIQLANSVVKHRNVRADVIPLGPYLAFGCLITVLIYAR